MCPFPGVFYLVSFLPPATCLALTSKVGTKPLLGFKTEGIQAVSHPPLGPWRHMFSITLVAIKGWHQTSCCSNTANITELSEVMHDFHSQKRLILFFSKFLLRGGKVHRILEIRYSAWVCHPSQMLQSCPFCPYCAFGTGVNQNSREELHIEERLIE